MKTLEHFYSADLDWVENLAAQFGGHVDGNFIFIPEDIQVGTRYVLKCDEGIIAYYIDVEFKRNLHLIQKNISTDFIGCYYNLTDGEATVSANNLKYDVSRWQYNLAFIDGTLESSYNVKKGSKTYALCVFIKKSIMESLAAKNEVTIPNLSTIMNPSKNTIIRFDRMSSDSYHLLDDLRKLKVGEPAFDFHLIGTVHMLIANYLKKIASRRIIIQTVDEKDLAAIIKTQMYLIEKIEDHFPGIKYLAEKAHMSESKFKNLFRKITGNTANAFFMENKLLLAKELLEKRQLTITQISNKLNFTNNSYFASKFKERFGISPKLFLTQL
jgi:AraC-like DNA-binding protein